MFAHSDLGGNGMATKSLYKREYQDALEVLRGLRERKKLTQTQLAELIGRQQTFVSAVERGSVRIDSLQIHDWVYACGATLEEWGRLMDEALAPPKAAKGRRKAP